MLTQVLMVIFHGSYITVVVKNLMGGSFRFKQIQLLNQMFNKAGRMQKHMLATYCQN